MLSAPTALCHLTLLSLRAVASQEAELQEHLDSGSFLITRRLSLFLGRVRSGCSPVSADPAAVAAWLRSALPGQLGPAAAAVAEAEARKKLPLPLSHNLSRLQKP